MQVPEELKKKYLERRIVDIQCLMSSLEKNDFEPALKLGHQMKGNAATFDFPQMGPMGIAIEKAAQSRDRDGVKLVAKKLMQEIQSARTAFP